MRDWKRKQKNFDEICDSVRRSSHQVGFLIVEIVGIVVAVISVTAVSVLGVVELWRRLKP
jgi:hypothetical protein